MKKNLEQKTFEPSIKSLYGAILFGVGSYLIFSEPFENFNENYYLLNTLAGMTSVGLASMFVITSYCVIKKKLTGKYPKNKIFNEIASIITETSNYPL